MIEVGSRIAHVEVYARGAVVTRSITLPAELPATAVELVVGGITPLAEAGSLRAVAAGRDVVALETHLVVPAAPAGPGALIERLRELELERKRLDAERTHAAWRHGQLTKLTLQMGLAARDRHVDPEQRVKDALAVGGLVGEAVATLEGRLLELDRAIETNVRAHEAAELAAAQGRSGDRAGAGHPTRQVVVRLAEGRATELSLSYVVSAARWWPAYTARLSDGATRASWALDAFVAQASGEDWTGVRLALSTADLVQDARLPELPSLRLGRAQPAARRGYRPPPPGLDELFASYDRALAAMAPPRGSTTPAPSSTRAKKALLREQHRPEPVTAEIAAQVSDEREEGEAASEAFDDLSSDTMVVDSPAPPPGGPPRRPMPAPAAAGAAMAPPAPMMMARARGGRAAAEPQEEAKRGWDAEEPAAIEPADAWLDFDALRLAAPGEPRRGRLVREPEPMRAGAPTPQSSARMLESIPSPPWTIDPRAVRGHFDHRYDADRAADVPSLAPGAAPHRVEVLRAAAPARPGFRTVPREAAEVYREVTLANPFDAPLLSGPVDVFFDEALLTTSSIAAVDRGGEIRLGLGVEDRVRVARNVKVDEGSAGMFGGSTVVETTVTIDVRSSLGRAIAVEIVDRAPVSDDPDVDVSVAGTPEPAPYDQAERGQPVRGGVRWLVDVPVGGAQKVVLRYKIKLPAKSELVGGNRRE